MSITSTPPRVSLGIDVAKLKLDVVLLLEDRPTHRIFANSAEGLAELHAWIQQQGACELSVCLESTGSYSDAIVRFLLAHGSIVSLLNPAVLVSDRKTKNMRRKTDTLTGMAGNPCVPCSTYARSLLCAPMRHCAPGPIVYNSVANPRRSSWSPSCASCFILPTEFGRTTRMMIQQWPLLLPRS